MTQNNTTAEVTPTEAENAPQSDESLAVDSQAVNTEPNAQDGQQSPDENDLEDKEKPKRPNEAAKYRTRLREAEAERDQLKAEFETERAQLTDRITLLEEATVKAWNPRGALSITALKAAGIEPSSLLNEDGTINTKAANEANKQAARTLGIPYTDPSVVKRDVMEELEWEREMRNGNGEASWSEVLNS